MVVVSCAREANIPGTSTWRQQILRYPSAQRNQAVHGAGHLQRPGYPHPAGSLSGSGLLPQQTGHREFRFYFVHDSRCGRRQRQFQHHHADGTLVRIEPVELDDDRRPLVEKMKAIAQSLPDLPEDWAARHDHYIHGTPKR